MHMMYFTENHICQDHVLQDIIIICCIRLLNVALLQVATAMNMPFGMQTCEYTGRGYS